MATMVFLPLLLFLQLLVERGSIKQTDMAVFKYFGECTVHLGLVTRQHTEGTVNKSADFQHVQCSGWDGRAGTGPEQKEKWTD